MSPQPRSSASSTTKFGRNGGGLSFVAARLADSSGMDANVTAAPRAAVRNSSRRVIDFPFMASPGRSRRSHAPHYIRRPEHLKTDARRTSTRR